MEKKDINIYENSFTEDNDDLIELDIIEDDEEKLDTSLPIPRLEIEGIISEEEVLFLKSKVFKSSKDTTLPLYIVFGLDRIMCGHLDLDLDNILELKFVGLNKYTLSLVSEQGSVEILSPDMGDLEISRLINFIRIR